MNDDTTSVLGAGIVGLCCALSLAERGHKVRVIDRDAPGRATSYGNAGVISPWSIVPQSMPGLWRKIPGLLMDPGKPLRVRASHWPRMVGWGLRFLANGREDRVRQVSDAMEHLCGPSVDLYRRHLSGTGHEHLVKDACYIHAFRNAGQADLSGLDYSLRAEKGADMAVLGADDLRALEPALSPEFKAAVLIKGQARADSPGAICAAIAEKARAMGVTFVHDDVVGVARDGDGWRIDCASGPRHSDTLVVAMGVWSAAMLKGMGLRLPLQAERGYHVEFEGPGVALTHSVMDVDRKVVLSSMEGRIRIAGQAEFAAIDAPPDPTRKAVLTRQASAALPGLNAREAEVWMGHRPSFPDSLPAIGEVQGQEGLFACFGHSHYGLMMAPKSGEIVADLVEGRVQNRDLSAYGVARF
ncbi:NAD(P)/FAD-dependent oxidoreductase [Jannaschia sp. CCS1]|uniref:NAD(P)/FAD-dependent oxidoreductase n=1 Tax=Jannaschia sp. (strain CCS1) TaxID=290400 RepID=UPI000053D663|nr:FAD-dependent oxidoreductase [Jannaschia sp. CCS1]ABD55797.1 FAD dependent oxidoreductase [Jannaschia sp. CCS1]